MTTLYKLIDAASQPVHRSTRVFPAKEIDARGQQVAKMQTKDANQFHNSAKIEKGNEHVIFKQHSRSGFSGGFKIPEEMRNKLEKRKYQKPKLGEQEEEDEKKDSQALNKDEILAELNLGTTETRIGSGKNGGNSKNAIQRDVIEGLQKDLEKLRREEDGIKLRKALAIGKPIIEETDSEKKRRIDRGIMDELEAQKVQVVAASEARIQAIRYKPGALDSLKAISLEEIDAELKIIKERNEWIEKHYWAKQQNSKVGAMIRKQMGLAKQGEDDEEQSEEEDKEPRQVKKDEKKQFALPKSVLKKKNEDFSEAKSQKTPTYKPKFELTQSEPIDFSEFSPKKAVYAAKFDKYLQSKQQENIIEQREVAMKENRFDTVTKINTISLLNKKNTPKENRKNYDQIGYLVDDDDYLLGEELLKNRNADPFKVLNVTNEEKLIFHLLQWKFKTSLLRDESGGSYVTKEELLKEFKTNDALRAASGLKDAKLFQTKIDTHCAKSGNLNWNELLDCFFMQEHMKVQVRSQLWWTQLDEEGRIRLPGQKNARRASENERSQSSGGNQRRKSKLVLEEFNEQQMVELKEEPTITANRHKTDQDLNDYDQNRGEQITLISDGYYAGDNSFRQSNQSQNQEDNFGQPEDDEDEFERDQNEDMKRSQSERVLGIQRETKSRIAKKGKYDVTVPSPFDFDMRDKNRQKTIAERKSEHDRMQREDNQRKIMKYQFHSKPIPQSTLQPRYYTLLAQKEQRRMQVKHESLEITKKNERPFNFYSRDLEKQAQKQDANAGLNVECNRPDFKACPIPKSCTVLIFSQQMHQQEIDRKKRIQENANASFARASMPSRMLKDFERKKSLQGNTHQNLEFSFQPKIGEPITGEMFKAMQKKFEEKLNRKKSQVAVTKPQSPKFTKTKNRPLDRDFVNEAEPAIKKFQTMMSKKTVVHDAQVKQPSSTRSMSLLQQRRREEINQSVQQEKDKHKENRKRKEMQNRLKSDVQEKLNGQISDTKKKTAEAALEKKRDWEEGCRKNKQELAQRVKAARDRGYLIDNYDEGGKKNSSHIDNMKNTQTFGQKVDNKK